MTIDTDRFSAQLRSKAIIPSEKRVLIARLAGSEQEKDLTMPVNCGGFGRLRHFRIHKHLDWSTDPLPNLPAAKALGRESTDTLKAQVFQLSACNWRCWYCFVDYNRLSADKRFAKYLTPGELIDKYLAEDDPADVIDLSGGQPDLVPEWTLWTMESLKERGLDDKVFLWADDNLSSRYFWEVLDVKQRRLIANFPKFSRVGCFKGYNSDSFVFNTLASHEIFERQFQIFRDLMYEGFDMYAYVTFTAMPHSGLQDIMKIFVDKLQGIHENLPLRTVPLKIESFSPMANRIDDRHKVALMFQHEVHAAWVDELSQRFSEEMHKVPICNVPMVI